MGEGISREATVNMEKKTMSIRAPLITRFPVESGFKFRFRISNIAIFNKFYCSHAEHKYKQQNFREDTKMVVYIG